MIGLPTIGTQCISVELWFESQMVGNMGCCTLSRILCGYTAIWVLTITHRQGWHRCDMDVAQGCFHRFEMGSIYYIIPQPHHLSSSCQQAIICIHSHNNYGAIERTVQHTATQHKPTEHLRVPRDCGCAWYTLGPS